MTEGSGPGSWIQAGQQKLARSEQTLARARAQLLRSEVRLRRIRVLLESSEQRQANAGPGRRHPGGRQA